MLTALFAGAIALMVIGSIAFVLERHQRHTPVTWAFTVLSALTIVAGAALGAVSSLDPADATPIERGFSENQLPDRVIDFQLPTL